MKRYILVSLWCEEDAATRLSHAFAQKLHDRRGAVEFIDGEAPSHDDLMRAAEASPEAAIVIFAHGGKALSPRPQGDPWIEADRLAHILSGRRVYAFACSTFRPHPALSLNTFAALAVSSCIEVFVGHEAPIMTPFAEQPEASRKMDDVLFHLIESFVDGEDSQSALVGIGQGYAPWDLPIELDLPPEEPKQQGALGWSSAAFLVGFFKCLRVRTKADDPRETG